MAVSTKARGLAADHGDADALARLLARKPAERVVWLAVDDDLMAAWSAAKDAHQLAASPFMKDDTRREEAVKNLADAEAALSASGAVRLLLRSKGRQKFRALIDEHPPREQDHKAAKEATGQATSVAMWNPDTFRPALVAFATVQPDGLTAELVAEMVDDGRLSDGELQHLVNVAQELHAGTRIADLGK